VNDPQTRSQGAGTAPPPGTLELLDEVSRALSEEAGASDDSQMCQRVVDAVGDAFDLPTGWVYLFDRETGEPRLAAARGLPPVFQEEPDRWEGVCWCVELLLTPLGPDDPAGNVDRIRCSRLQGIGAGEAAGITHHTSVPLTAAGRQVGVMNLARGDWQPVNDRDLAVLIMVGRLLAAGVVGRQEQDGVVAAALAADRMRVAQELHDTAMQALTGVTLNLDVAAAQLESDPVAAAERLERGAQLAQQALDETRAAIAGLHLRATESGGLAAAVGRVADEFTQTYGIPVKREISLDASPLPPAIEHGLLRVVSEGLHNVVKHAEATEARLVLRRRGQRVTLILEDDGRGFDPSSAEATPHGYGLQSMRIRVRLLGGRFRLKTAPGAGTRVEVSLGIDG
jgi:two-component system, NarL family, sensor kinase